MTWARIDDGLYDDPRATAAGLDAMGLYVLAASYMGRYNTDGAITRERAKKLAGRRAAALAARLVGAGLWDATAEGWCLVAWEGVLVPRVEVERRSEGARAAGSKGGRTRARRAAEREPGADVGPSSSEATEQTPEISPTYPRDNPADISRVQDANSAKENRTVQPTPAHDPEPDPVPDSAHARAGDPPQLVESRDKAKDQPRPSFVDIADPPAADLAGGEPETERARELQNKGAPLGVNSTDPPGPKPSPRAPACPAPGGAGGQAALPGLEVEPRKKPRAGEHPYSLAWVRGHAAAENGGPITGLSGNEVKLIGRAAATHARARTLTDPDGQPITGPALVQWLEERVRTFRERTPNPAKRRGGYSAWGFVQWLNEEAAIPPHPTELIPDPPGANDPPRPPPEVVRTPEQLAEAAELAKLGMPEIMRRIEEARKYAGHGYAA